MQERAEMQIYPVLTTVQIIVCFINCIVGIRLFKDKNQNIFERKYIYSFCILDLVTGIIIKYYNLTDDSVWYFPLFELIFLFSEIILLPAFICSTMNLKQNKIMLILLCIIPPIISQLLFNYPTFLSQAISGIYISIYCIKYLKWLLSTKKIFPLAQTRHFWIVIGIMICYTATIPSCFTILLLHSVAKTELETQFADLIINFYLILNITMHIFFLKALTCDKVQKSSFSYQ